MKILLLVPAYTASGGIKSYFQTLENNFSMDVNYMIRGARTWPYRKGFFKEAIRALKDLHIFLEKLNKEKYSIVQTSTSLSHYALLRDGLFLYFARRKGIKTIVFFHGWKSNIEQLIEKRFLWLFRYLFFKSNTFIVLAPQFKEKLKNWGYSGEIHLETTIVDEQLVKNVSLKTIETKFKHLDDKINLLFLARVEIQKGIYETINAYHIFKKKNPLIQLIIAGDGRELENAKSFVAANQIEDVDFKGYITGDEKIRVFNESHIYILPSYTEGMPNSILEAMAFGLPVITRPVGGIQSVVEHKVNGYLIQDKEPDSFAECIEKLLKSDKDMCAIALRNHIKSKETFTTDNVVKRLEKIYHNLL